MENDKKFWRSQIQIVSSSNYKLLQESINEFCKDKFVVGIQYPDAWQTKLRLVAVVSYKVQEASDQMMEFKNNTDQKILVTFGESEKLEKTIRHGVESGDYMNIDWENCDFITISIF